MKAGRNDPCPCGSGKKYKKCCGLKSSHAAARPHFDAARELQTAMRYHQAGMLQQAEEIYRRVLQMQPGHVDALHLSGVVAHQSGRHEAAADLIGRAIALNPREPRFYINLGAVLRTLGKPAEAAACFREALRLKPDLAEAYNNLGNALQEEGKAGEAEASYRKALDLSPGSSEAHNNLGTALRGQGRLQEAEQCYREALRINPAYAEAHSGLLFCLLYDPGQSPELLFRESAAWGERHAPRTLFMPPAQNVPDPGRRLRIGYVSGDFRRHPVGYFLEGVLAAHDKAQFEIFCYANQHKDDEVTQRLKRSSDHWCSLIGIPDDAAARLVRQDGIDILVDLAGHTAGNRLLLFARKPAPVQATWMGYSATTGMRAMDYIIADRFLIPQQEEHLYTERPVRLPGSYLCYTPPAAPIECGELPARATGGITFGSFNNPAKVTPQVVRRWAEILHAVPGARLYMKYAGLDTEAVRTRYRGLFSDCGIPGDRLQFRGATEQLLPEYRQVDIALDPFPYNGTTTTIEALWMGVPVIALKGDRFTAHVGESFLNSAGLGELVALSGEEYVAKAAELAGDLPRLAELRRNLRPRIETTLCDAQAFARGLENAYRAMWREWCREKQE